MAMCGYCEEGLVSKPAPSLESSTFKVRPARVAETFDEQEPAPVKVISNHDCIAFARTHNDARPRMQDSGDARVGEVLVDRSTVGSDGSNAT